MWSSRVVGLHSHGLAHREVYEKSPDEEENKVYLEWEYTKNRITDFEFKLLMVLPSEVYLSMNHDVSPQLPAIIALSQNSPQERHARRWPSVTPSISNAKGR